MIKRFINWLINLLKRLFGVNKKENRKNIISNKKDNKKNKLEANITSPLEEAMPGYMMLSDTEKEKLIYSISLMINFLTENNAKKREIEEEKIIQTIREKYNINVAKIIDQKHLELVIKELKPEDKDDIIDVFQTMIKKEQDFKVHVSEVDRVIDLIKQNDISIIEEYEIAKEVSMITNDKNLSENSEEKIDYFNQNVLNIIDNVDKDFLNKVFEEYRIINYVSVSTKIIDMKNEEFKKLQDDFKHHRYNKFYYEREINRLKQELNQIKNLKNRKDVSAHIEKLRKELYTKSKDKYDLLYNDEVFMNFDKECNALLDKINTKVIDIKKEKQEEPKKEEDKRNKYLENIIKRFQDMELARKMILLSQLEDSELINDPNYDFTSEIINKYNNGLDKEFNFERNKKKTELVILFNELNLAINKINKEPFITIDHINFRMDDLTEAVEVKKGELSKLTKSSFPMESEKKDNKVKSLIYNPNEKK